MKITTEVKTQPVAARPNIEQIFSSIDHSCMFLSAQEKRVALLSISETLTNLNLVDQVSFIDMRSVVVITISQGDEVMARSLSL